MIDLLHNHIWLWCHPAGSHTRSREQHGLPGRSTISPAEAARFLDIPNVLMVRYELDPQPPFDVHARPLASMHQVVWSIEGGGGGDVASVLELMPSLPNLQGVILDDYFARVTATARMGMAEPVGSEIKADPAFSVEALQGLRNRLAVGERQLDIWVVLYAHELQWQAILQPHLQLCDVVTLWTWNAAELTQLEQNFACFEQLAGNKRKALGLYMWDYGTKQAMPLPAMEHQCGLARRWLLEGRIESMIFLASCICDLGLDAVAWTREWIAANGATTVSTDGF